MFVTTTMLSLNHDRSSERVVTMLRSSDLVEVGKKEMDISPAILIPYYDADSSTLFLTGKVSG